MSKPIRLYVLNMDDPDEDEIVFDEASLRAVGLETDADVEANFEAQGKWVEIWLRKAFGEQETEVARLCRIPDEQRGFLYDETREPAARLCVMVEKWNGIRFSPDSMTARAGLGLDLARYLDRVIVAKMYPSAVANPFFIAAWKRKQSSSAESSPSA